jgi:hypothetical protein
MPSDPATGMTRTWPRWWYVAGGVLLALGVLAAVLSLMVRPRLNDWARARTVETLSEQFDSEVELGALGVRPGMVFRVTGADLVLRHKGRRDVPPLIVVSSFDVRASLWRMLRSPRRISQVELRGLHINIPPRYSDDEERFPGATPPSERPDRPPVPTDRPKPEVERAEVEDPKPSPVVIDALHSMEARLTIVPKEGDKEPKVFELHTLDMTEVALDRPIPFEALLDNPVPRGRIETHGLFGPWARGEPGLTPLEGRFEFEDADLGTINGIGGLLQARGTFGGVLDRIEADGTTTTPDFHLDTAEQPVQLDTAFSAVIDGTNGNTWLDPVRAHLGEGTAILASGGVVKVTREDEGRTIDLDVRIDDGRIDDILRLAVKSAEPLMRGGIDLQAKMLIPPGAVPVVRKMRLDGSFTLKDAIFTSDGIQDKVDELSKRAQGRPEDAGVDDVLSDFKGRFTMRNGTITFPSLSFVTQGARVQLAGHYTADGAMDFEGTIRMSADVSQMVTGRKRFFLRIFDPLMRSDGATQFPIHIRGTVDDPDFGVNVGKTLRQMITPGG